MESAMVQIVENRAAVAGELRAVRPDPDRPGFVLLTVECREAREVGGLPNFFASDVGRTIEIVAREGSPAARAAPGPIAIEVRKAAPGVSFATER